MVKKILTVCVTTLIFCSTLKATELSYSNFEIHYGNNDGTETWGFGVSDELNDNVHLIVSTINAESDTPEGDLISLGIGYHSPIGRETDVVISASYIETEFDVLPFVSKEYGYGLMVGVRSMTSDILEVNAGISHVDVGGSSSADFTFGAVINLSGSTALILNSGITLDSERDLDFAIGFRFSN